MRKIIVLLFVLVFHSIYSCTPKNSKEANEEKNYTRFGNEMFLGFRYGISRSVFLNRLNDLVKKKILEINKENDYYYYYFNSAIIDSQTNKVNQEIFFGKFNIEKDAKIDSEHGLYGLTIHLNTYYEHDMKSGEEMRKYFSDLLTTKYGKSEDASEFEYVFNILQCIHYFKIWSDKKVSIRLDQFDTKEKPDDYDKYVRGKDHVDRLNTDIIYLNDSIYGIIKMKDNENEERRNQELIKKSNENINRL